MGWGVNGSESVATMWARMVRDAEAGEVVAIRDKHGKDVAVMMGMEQYNHLLDELERLHTDG